MNKEKLRAVIFDLDGVIVSTDEYHFRAWSKIAGQEGITFDRRQNDSLRGVSRMESLELLLGGQAALYSAEQKQALAEQKNEYYRTLLNMLTPQDILPGITPLLKSLKEAGIKRAIGSSSRNAENILTKIGLMDAFDVIVTGNDIQHSKPDPEVYLVAAKKLSEDPSACMVIEDAEAGVEAGYAAGMITLAVGSACGYAAADVSYANLESTTAALLQEMFARVQKTGKMKTGGKR